MTDVFLLLSGLLTGAVRVLAGLILIHRLLSVKKPGGKSIAAEIGRAHV